jgi:all-trans-8'-apo-beta-carotenal 15,15'-oxygenase
MHPLLTLLAGLSSSSTTPTTNIQSSFWEDRTRIQSLADPPSDKFLPKIQEEPWRGGLEPIPVEGISLHEAQVIEGTIPSDLQGMLCRNGPGRTRIGDTQYGHWFDSDGVVSQLCIDGANQKATFMAKYVKTERFEAQQKIEQTTGDVPMATAGAWTKRGLGKWWENIFAIPTNPSNTNIIFLEDKGNPTQPQLFALSEGGDPVKMDAKTLETIEAKAYGNAKGESVSSFFSAHYKKDPTTGDVYNHGVILGPKAKVNAIRLNGSGEMLGQSATELPNLSFIHDNILSENYFVTLVQPFSSPPSGLLTSIFGGDPLGSQLTWNTEELPESVALVFSKDTLECVAQVSLPILSTYHQLDAFEDPSNSNIITLRALVHGPPSSRMRLEDGFKDLYSHTKIPLCEIMEYVIDIDAGKMISTRRVAPKASLCELPDVNAGWGYRKRYVWTNTRTENVGFVNSLQKVDLETGDCSDVVSFGDAVFAGNPIFVPKENAQKEDDGYILSQLYRSDEHRSDVCILDAATMKQLTLLRLDTHMTYQFHGGWYPGSF